MCVCECVKVQGNKGEGFSFLCAFWRQKYTFCAFSNYRLTMKFENVTARVLAPVTGPPRQRQAGPRARFLIITGSNQISTGGYKSYLSLFYAVTSQWPLPYNVFGAQWLTSKQVSQIKSHLNEGRDEKDTSFQTLAFLFPTPHLRQVIENKAFLRGHSQSAAPQTVDPFITKSLNSLGTTCSLLQTGQTLKVRQHY